MGGILEEIIAKLPSKKFGKMKLYFDKDSKRVKIIENDGTYTYVLTSAENGKVSHILKTELSPGRCIDCEISFGRTWIIPEVLKLDRVEEVESDDAKDDVAKMLLDKVFVIVSYTILEFAIFKGSDFSNSIVMVIAENPQGKRFAVPYLVDKGVHGGDEDLAGAIMGEAYQFTPLGSISSNGTLFIDNLL